MLWMEVATYPQALTDLHKYYVILVLYELLYNTLLEYCHIAVATLTKVALKSSLLMLEIDLILKEVVRLPDDFAVFVENDNR